MAAFQDKAGRDWSVVIDADSLRRLSGIGVSERRIVDGMFLSATAGSPAFLAQSLYCLCEFQVLQRQMTPEQFARVLAGSLEPATRALVDAVLFFMPADLRAEAIRIHGEKTRRMA
jgi:hypothetical protein